MPPSSKVVTGVAAVVEHDGCLLMVKRGGTQWYADGHGSWCVPGGWLEPGEYPSEAAKRETMEETGVTVSPGVSYGCTTNWNSVNALWIVTLFVRCQYVYGEPTVTEPDKCPEVEWVPLIEVDGRDLFTPLKLWRHTYLSV